MTPLSHISSAYYALDSRLTKDTSYLAFKNYQSTYRLEQSKSQDYVWLTTAGIPMPLSVPWNSPGQLVDLITQHQTCVVKQDTCKTLGIQTTVVRAITDLQHVVKSLQYTNERTGIIQKHVVGVESTVIVLVGDHNWTLVGAARDYKKQYDDNQGLNTFGLGSINLPHIPDNILDLVDRLVSCYREKYQYQGFLSCQFITDANQQPWLLECNTRLCDPEFQSMVVNLPDNFENRIIQALTGQPISEYQLGQTNSVTIGLINQDWPTLQPTRVNINLPTCAFEISPYHGTSDANCYFGSVTNSGLVSHQQLAAQIYQYLATATVAPYRYRNDIAR